jgi:hypothetical protein
MLNLNKAQIVQSRQYFDSDVIGNRTVGKNLAAFEDYRSTEIHKSKLTAKAKFNLSIAYFAALTVMLVLLFA